LAGVSVGGFSSLAYASAYPEDVAAVINFAGGKGSVEPYKVCSEESLIYTVGSEVGGVGAASANGGEQSVNLVLKTAGKLLPFAEANGPYLGVAGQPVTFDAGGSYDPDGDNLSYLWSQTAGNPVTLSGNATVQTTFTPTVADNYTFQIVVNDGKLNSAPDSVVISVRTINNPPVLSNLVLSPDTRYISTNITCSVTYTDADNDVPGM
jgi:pimeloyl-ACP methyl ester carboxylesterase